MDSITRATMKKRITDILHKTYNDIYNQKLLNEGCTNWLISVKELEIIKSSVFIVQGCIVTESCQYFTLYCKNTKLQLKSPKS